MAGIGAIRPELPVRAVGWRCTFSDLPQYSPTA
jgi:hypothetical protein